METSDLKKGDRVRFIPTKLHVTGKVWDSYSFAGHMWYFMIWDDENVLTSMYPCLREELELLTEGDND